MNTRKPKPTLSPLIEWPTEQLQLVPVTVEQKAPAQAKALAQAGLTQLAGGAATDGSQQLELRPARHVGVKGARRLWLN
jgi:hypothetical protein